MKAIIIGTSLSGKTTIIRELNKSRVSSPVTEMDQKLTELNNGEFPSDNEKKMKTAKDVIQWVLAQEDIIFFTNTDYFTKEDLVEARGKGFKIIQLNVELQELFRRNQKRLKDEGYQDMSEWLPGMVKYQKQIFDSGVVDKKIDASDTTQQIVKELLKT